MHCYALLQGILAVYQNEGPRAEASELFVCGNLVDLLASAVGRLDVATFPPCWRFHSVISDCS